VENPCGESVDYEPTQGGNENPPQNQTNSYTALSREDAMGRLRSNANLFHSLVFERSPMITSDEFEKRFEEIESIQKQVANILYSNNWLVRVFLFGKAQRLHKLDQAKLDALLEEDGL